MFELVLIFASPEMMAAVDCCDNLLKKRRAAPRPTFLEDRVKSLVQAERFKRNGRPIPVAAEHSLGYGIPTGLSAEGKPNLGWPHPMDPYFDERLISPVERDGQCASSGRDCLALRRTNQRIQHVLLLGSRPKPALSVKAVSNSI